MTILPIILMHHYCSLFFSCFLHHDERWTTKQALSAMPNGLCKGLVEFPRQWRLGPSNRTIGIFAGKSNNHTFHPAAPDSQSTISHLAQRHPLSAPKSPVLLWGLLLGAGADQVLTLAGSNPVESIEKKLVCSLSSHCFILVFTGVWKWTHCYISANSF